MSYVDRETRARLNDLSKHVWGASSAWMKYLDGGILVPADDKENEIFNIEDSTKGRRFKLRKWYTVETIEALMLDLLKKIQETNVKKV